MTENIAQTIQKVIQDLVPPDVRELKTLVTNLQSQLTYVESSLQKQIDQRFDAQNQKTDAQFKAMDQKFEALSEKTDAQFKAMDQKTDAQFKALMSALGEFKAQSELTTVRVISQLSERVAILEARR